MTEQDVMFVEDVAKVFGISANTLQRKKWREQSGIPLHKIGKKLCGFKSEIEKWVKTK